MRIRSAEGADRTHAMNLVGRREGRSRLVVGVSVVDESESDERIPARMAVPRVPVLGVSMRGHSSVEG